MIYKNTSSFYYLKVLYKTFTPLSEEILVTLVNNILIFFMHKYF